MCDMKLKKTTNKLSILLFMIYKQLAIFLLKEDLESIWILAFFAVMKKTTSQSMCFPPPLLLPSLSVRTWGQNLNTNTEGRDYVLSVRANREHKIIQKIRFCQVKKRENKKEK